MSGKKRLGFAAMDPSKHREIARMGGEAVSQDTKHMAKIGSLGGISSGYARRNKRRTKAEMQQLVEP